MVPINREENKLTHYDKNDNYLAYYYYFVYTTYTQNNNKQIKYNSFVIKL